MQKINLEKSNAAITSVNQRAEKHGDEKKIAVDIDIRTEIDVEFLNQLAIGDDICEYGSLLYDEKGNVKTLGIKSITLDREYKDHTAIITLEDLQDSSVTLIEVKVKKFSAVPVYGKRVMLGLQIQCMPDDEQLVFLAHAMTKSSVIVEIIESKQTDLFDADKENEDTKENETAEA